jgi:hypothetical protein
MRVNDRFVIRFMGAVMNRAGAQNPTDLSKLMGHPWTERDQQRRGVAARAGRRLAEAGVPEQNHSDDTDDDAEHEQRPTRHQVFVPFVMP